MAVIINNGKGTVKIPNAVIGEVAYTAAKECGGVSEITAGVQKSKNGNRALKVTSNGGGFEIRLGITMRYGENVGDVSAELSKIIREKVMEFTGVDNLKIFLDISNISV